ncbi:MAG: hypothetical protein AABW45_00975 [Nanoarchaeota archaeon]
MKIKKILLSSLLSLFLGYNITNSQEKDTTKTYSLEEVVVIGNKKDDKKLLNERSSLETIYNNDVNKTLLNQPGVNTAMPILSTLSIHSLPSDQFAGFYYGNIRIMGRTTQMQGAYSIINPDLAEVELEKISYSTKYDDLGGIIKIIPKKYYGNKIKFKLSSDLVQRIITLNAPVDVSEIRLHGSTSTSVRNIEAIELLEKIVPETKLLPKIMEIQNYSNLDINGTRLEINYRKAIEENNYNGQKEYDISKINESSIQDLIIIQYNYPLENFDIKTSFAYEYDNLSSNENFKDIEHETELKTKNTTLALEFSDKNNNYKAGLSTYLMRTNQMDKSKDIDVLRMYTEANYIYENLLFKPSFGVAEFHGAFAGLYGLNISYLPEDLSLTFGFNHIANFLIHNNGLIGSVSKLNEEIKPQTADHYSFLVNYRKGFFDNIELLLYRKNFDANFNGEISKGFVNGMDFLFSKEGKFNYKFISSVSNSNVNGHKIPGAVDKIFELSSNSKIFDNLELITQLRYQDGIYHKNKENNDYERLNNSIYLNLGGRTAISLVSNEVSLSFTIYNLLYPFGQKNEIARYKDAKNNINSVRMPIWANVGVYYKF